MDFVLKMNKSEMKGLGMKAPKVSIVMSVYNCERYVGEAVKSMLQQTFSDFEFIIVNDGSTDQTPEILRQFDDPRILVIDQRNSGLTVSLNRGIRLAKGEYIARMDADDLSEPERLEKQVEALDRNPGIGVVSCWYKVIDENGFLLAYKRLPNDVKQLAKLLMRDNPICHGSVMMRKRAIQTVGLYNENLRYAQDYELWLRMLRQGYGFYVIPEFLYSYRISPDSVSKLYVQEKYAALIRKGKQKVFHLPEVTTIYRLSARRKRALYYYALGTLKLEGGQTKDSREELLRSIKLDPLNMRPWYRLTLSFFPRWVRDFVSNIVKQVNDRLVLLRWP